MTSLNLGPNLDRADDFYAGLLAAHEGLSEAETHALNARLLLILANHIGSGNVLAEALAAAKQAPRGE
ncbi:MAG: DUF2783 domain-containing protein [Geminicoccaceae bacterium]